MSAKAGFRRRLALFKPWSPLIALGLALVLTMAVVVGVAVVRSAPPMIVLQLNTEILVHRVARQALSTIAVADADFPPGTACLNVLTGGRFTGTIEPPEGSLVTYRWAPAALTIDVQVPLVVRKDSSTEPQAPADIRLGTHDQQECTLRQERFSVRVNRAPDSSDPAWQLPIAGPAVAGKEFGTQLAPGSDRQRSYDMLLGGTVSVFGKSLDNGMLFPIAQSAYQIPAGSRLASAAAVPVGDADAGASWYGVANYSASGLAVSATTETNELLLFRPDPNSQRVTFGIGLLAGVLGDPGIGMLAFMVATFLALSGLVSGWISLWPDPPDDTSGQPTVVANAADDAAPAVPAAAAPPAPAATDQ